MTPLVAMTRCDAGSLELPDHSAERRC